jgi:hypothetical protein
MMPQQIEVSRFTTELFDLLDETFENHHGIYLNKGTSLFATLAEVNAAEASQPVGGKCATIAAQVAHIIFYLEVLERYILEGGNGNVDWGEIWRTVNKVTPEEWNTLKHQLQQTYQRVLAMLKSDIDWGGETTIGGALAIVIHTAYHLGEIRQALCIVK